MIGHISEKISENFKSKWPVEQFPLQEILVSMVNGSNIFQGSLRMIVSKKINFFLTVTISRIGKLS